MKKVNIGRKIKLLKIALKRVLTLPKARARREFSIGVIYVNRASIYVELRPFYCSVRILAPMSDISLLNLLKL